MRERSTRPSAKRVGRRAWVAALALSAVLGWAAPAPAAPAPARGEHPVIAGTGIAFDLIILRPLRLGQLVFGFVCFVPAALFAGETVADPWDLFVVEPFEATFTRPLGDIEEEY
jgi:hypothetical protein